MRRHYVNDGYVNLVKGLIVLLCMISLMDSMTRDVEAEVKSNPKEDAYFKELKERQAARYKRVQRKYGRKPAVETWE